MLVHSNETTGYQNNTYILTVFKIDDTTMPHKRLNSTVPKRSPSNSGGLAAELEDAGKIKIGRPE